jgi:predicted nucleotidyltransferase
MKNKFLIKEGFDSINLFDKVSLLNERQIAKISLGIEWTFNNYPSAVLIGGTALIHYVENSRDLTPDIDFMIDDISDLKLILEENDVQFGDLKSGNIGLLGINVDEFNVDYLDSNMGNVALNKLVLKTFKIANIGGFQVKIINPELLAIMKTELGRDKDLNDAFALLASGKLNKDYYLRLANSLKNHLSDYESIVSYVEMIKQ